MISYDSMITKLCRYEDVQVINLQKGALHIFRHTYQITTDSNPLRTLPKTIPQSAPKQDPQIAHHKYNKTLIQGIIIRTKPYAQTQTLNSTNPIITADTQATPHSSSCPLAHSCPVAQHPPDPRRPRVTSVPRAIK